MDVKSSYLCMVELSDILFVLFRQLSKCSKNTVMIHVKNKSFK